MSGICASVGGDQLIVDMFSAVDCRMALLGSQGYRALANSSLFAGLTTGLLTLVIALQGWRLLTGSALGVGDAVKVLARIGVVLALGASWPAYNTLIYRTVVEGPGEIAGLVLPAAGLEERALSTRLQALYDAIRQPPGAASGANGAAQPVGAGAAAETVGAQAAAAPAISLATPTPPPGGLSRRAQAALFIVGGAGPLLAARVASALLLAIGPLALVALLFEASTGLFVGWLRALCGAALCGLAALAVTAMEIDLIDGPVRQAVDSGTVDIPGLDVLLGACAVMMVGALIAAGRMAGGLRLPVIVPNPAPSALSLTAAKPAPTEAKTSPAPLQARAAAPATRPHARTVSGALEAAVRRERGGGTLLEGAAPRPVSIGRTNALQGERMTGLGDRFARTGGRRAVIGKLRQAGG